MADSPTCENCRWWKRGSLYFMEPYGSTPRRAAWSLHQSGKFSQQEGECRIVAPYRSGGSFPFTFEFQSCGEHSPEGGAHG